MPNAHVAVNPLTFPVGPPMDNGVSHFFEDDWRDGLTVQMDEASNTAH
jgi:hypothetical protein